MNIWKIIYFHIFDSMLNTSCIAFDVNIKYIFPILISNYSISECFSSLILPSYDGSKNKKSCIINQDIDFSMLLKCLFEAFFNVLFITYICVNELNVLCIKSLSYFFNCFYALDSVDVRYNYFTSFSHKSWCDGFSYSWRPTSYNSNLII
jgi:hypothetical protein